MWMTMNIKSRWEKRIKKKLQSILDRPVTRRSMLGMFVGSTVATSTLLKKSRAFSKVDTAGVGLSVQQFFQEHYKEMSPDDKAEVFQRIADEQKKRFGVDVTITDPEPMDQVMFAYCLNLSRCNGNRKCVEACVKENNQGREPAIQYIRVLEMDAGSMNLEKSNPYYEGKVPQEGKFYLPVQCNQCDNPPCVKVCPVEATWKEKDGIVVIDSDWCIGCRYCMAGCPYEARSFNFTEPKIPAAELNPKQGYLSNRVRPKGVVEKCHFCLHRVREGLNPACHDACPTGARKFGNLLDPNSEVHRIIRDKRVFVLKEELGTLPRFYYYFD